MRGQLSQRKNIEVPRILKEKQYNQERSELLELESILRQIAIDVNKYQSLSDTINGKKFKMPVSEALRREVIKKIKLRNRVNENKNHKKNKMFSPLSFNFWFDHWLKISGAVKVIKQFKLKNRVVKNNKTRINKRLAGKSRLLTPKTKIKKLNISTRITPSSKISINRKINVKFEILEHIVPVSSINKSPSMIGNSLILKNNIEIIQRKQIIEKTTITQTTRTFVERISSNQNHNVGSFVKMLEDSRNANIITNENKELDSK